VKKKIVKKIHYTKSFLQICTTPNRKLPNNSLEPPPLVEGGEVQIEIIIILHPKIKISTESKYIQKLLKLLENIN